MEFLLTLLLALTKVFCTLCEQRDRVAQKLALTRAQNRVRQ